MSDFNGMTMGPGDDKGHPAFRILLAAGLVLALMFAGVALFFAINSTRAKGVSNEALVRQVKGLVTQIQDERVRNIKSNCLGQNKRNLDTLEEIDKQIDELPVDRRAAARQARSGTAQIIDALAPVRDCDALAESQAKSAATPIG